jgi:hypothetical protein
MYANTEYNTFNETETRPSAPDAPDFDKIEKSVQEHHNRPIGTLPKRIIPFTKAVTPVTETSLRELLNSVATFLILPAGAAWNIAYTSDNRVKMIMGFSAMAPNLFPDIADILSLEDTDINILVRRLADEEPDNIFMKHFKLILSLTSAIVPPVAAGVMIAYNNEFKNPTRAELDGGHYFQAALALAISPLPNLIKTLVDEKSLSVLVKKISNTDPTTNNIFFYLFTGINVAIPLAGAYTLSKDHDILEKHAVATTIAALVCFVNLTALTYMKRSHISELRGQVLSNNYQLKGRPFNSEIVPSSFPWLSKNGWVSRVQKEFIKHALFEFAACALAAGGAGVALSGGANQFGGCFVGMMMVILTSKILANTLKFDSAADKLSIANAVAAGPNQG